MHEHVSIGYDLDGFAEVSNRIRELAAANPNVFIDDVSPQEYGVVCCGSPEAAAWAKEQLDAGRTISATIGVVDVMVVGGVLSVNRECGEEAARDMTTLLRQILDEFPDYRIFDEDRKEDITDRIQADRNVLFQ